MKTREILRQDWPKFFDNLSCKQEGWEVKVEVFGPEIGDQIEEQNLFLSGITAELRTESDTIEIMMGAKAGEHVTHMIAAPTRVDLQQTELGIDAAVQIKSADGNTTLLHLT